MVHKKSPSSITHCGTPISPTADEILRQQQQIFDSPEFHATQSQIAFLKFVVGKVIAGESGDIKGFLLATHLFGRNEDFDQNNDPIVSIHANKLRRALERYYLTAGRNDLLRIDIPKGSYIPTFTYQTAVLPDATRSESANPIIPEESSWPTILIRPFQCLTNHSDENYLLIGLATELGVELSKYQDFRVVLQDTGGYGKRETDTGIRFMIDGTIRKDETGTRLSIHLIDAVNGTQLWGETFRFDHDVSAVAAFEEKIAHTVAVKLAGEYGIIVKTMSAESKNKPPSELKAFEAILRYYEFDRLLTEESFLRALEALEYAATVEPECGQVWSMLGRLYGNVYSLELPGFETALEKAIAYAQKGVQLNPENQRARGVLAYIRMFSNELPAAREELKKALALNPRSLLGLDGIAYLMTLLGDWENGPATIRRVIQLNPYYGLFVHYALWTDFLRQGKYAQAHLETLNFCRPLIFWEPLMKAATFGHLGRIEEGKQAVQNLLTLKPDFPARGRILIGHYIKFDDIFERIVDGLGKVGLEID